MSTNTTFEYEEELEDEELDVDMPTFEHGMLCTRISRHLGNYLEGKDLGEVVDSSPEFRYLPKRKTKSGKEQQPYRQADVSFVGKARLPQRLDSYPEIPPDLAIEVVSPTDKEVENEKKIEEYQKHGVRLVWLVHPFSRRIDVYRLANGLIPEPFGIDRELNGEDVIPGFKLPVSRIFDYPRPEPQEDDD